MTFFQNGESAVIGSLKAVQSFNLEGELVEHEAEELFSRAIQHETDHLDGKLFIDYLGTLARHSIKDKLREFETQFRLNLRPAYLVCAAAIPVLLEAGGGAIVCVSTRAALRPFPGAAGYIASKAAVLAFVDALATEYTQDGIRANAILPSVIDTPANRASMPDADHDKWVKPPEIARVVRFLCSDDAGVTSGAHIPVYGRA